MYKEILFVSNKSECLSEEAINKINQICDTIECNKRHISLVSVLQDCNMFNLLNGRNNSIVIQGLDSPGDKLLYASLNKDIDINKLKFKKCDEYTNIGKLAIRRFKSPNINKVYDKLEYESMRMAVMNNRIKFFINNVINNFKFIIHVKNKKENNFINSTIQSHGDGLFYYEFDDINKKGTFYVGGVSVKEDDLFRFLREV